MDFCPKCEARLKKNSDGLLACPKCEFVKEGAAKEGVKKLRVGIKPETRIIARGETKIYNDQNWVKIFFFLEKGISMPKLPINAQLLKQSVSL